MRWKWLAVTITLIVFVISAGLSAFFPHSVNGASYRLFPEVEFAYKFFLLISAVVLIVLGAVGVLKYVALPIRTITRKPHQDFIISEAEACESQPDAETDPKVCEVEEEPTRVASEIKAEAETEKPVKKIFGTPSAVVSIIASALVVLIGLAACGLFGIGILFSLPNGKWNGDTWVETSWFDGNEIAHYHPCGPLLLCEKHALPPDPTPADTGDGKHGSDQGNNAGTADGSNKPEPQTPAGKTAAAGQPVVDLDKIPYWLPTPDPKKRVEPDPAKQLGNLASADKTLPTIPGQNFHQIPGSAYAVVEFSAAGPASLQVFAQFSYGKWEVLAILPDTAPFKEGELSGLPVANSRGIPKEIKLKFLPRSADSVKDTRDYVSTDGGYTWKRDN